MSKNITYEEVLKLALANIDAIDKMREENRERAKEADEKRKKESDDWKKRYKEADEREEIRFKKRDKELNRLEKMFDGMGYTQGMISEDLVGENFQDVLNDAGENISSIQKNVTVFEGKKQMAEFDIIGINGTKVFVGETKTKLTKNHIDKFLEKTLPNFEKYLLKKRYSGLKMYGVMGARVFADDKTKDYAISQGLYVMKENHKGGLKIIKKSIKNAKVFA